MQVPVEFVFIKHRLFGDIEPICSPLVMDAKLQTVLHLSVQEKIWKNNVFPSIRFQHIEKCPIIIYIVLSVRWDHILLANANLSLRSYQANNVQSEHSYQPALYCDRFRCSFTTNTKNNMANVLAS